MTLKFKVLYPLEGMKQALEKSPIFGIMRNEALCEATEKAHKILVHGFAEPDFKDNNLWNVAPIVVKVRSHKRIRETTLSCKCEAYKLYRFCEHTIAVTLKWEKTNK